MIKHGQFYGLLISNVEFNEDEKRWDALHHPFTAPKDGHEEFLENDPGQCLSKAYDLVINGWEVVGVNPYS